MFKKRMFIYFAIGLAISGVQFLAHADGKTTYDSYCAVCHANGLAGAPKKGDKKAWAPRLKQGESVLMEHTKNGIRAMPAKGTCMSCSEADLKAAIKYMTK